MQHNKISYCHIRRTDIVLFERLSRKYPPANAAWGTFSVSFDLPRVPRVVVGTGIPGYLPD